MKYFLVFCMGAASLSCKSRSQSGLLAEPELRADAIKYSQQLIQEVYAKRKEIESKVDQLKPLMKTRRLAVVRGWHATAGTPPHHFPLPEMRIELGFLVNATYRPIPQLNFTEGTTYGEVERFFDIAQQPPGFELMKPATSSEQIPERWGLDAYLPYTPRNPGPVPMDGRNPGVWESYYLRSFREDLLQLSIFELSNDNAAKDILYYIDKMNAARSAALEQRSKRNLDDVAANFQKAVEIIRKNGKVVYSEVPPQWRYEYYLNAERAEASINRAMLEIRATDIEDMLPGFAGDYVLSGNDWKGSDESRRLKCPESVKIVPGKGVYNSPWVENDPESDFGKVRRDWPFIAKYDIPTIGDNCYSLLDSIKFSRASVDGNDKLSFKCEGSTTNKVRARSEVEITKLGDLANLSAKFLETSYYRVSNHDFKQTYAKDSNSGTCRYERKITP